MISKAQDIQPGSLLFVSYGTILSKIRCRLSGFQFSDIAIYLGKNEIVEPSWFGYKTRVVSFSKYLGNDSIVGEICHPFTDPDDATLFLRRIKKLRQSPLPSLKIIEGALFSVGFDLPEQKKDVTVKDIYDLVCKKGQK